jgi:hypothetical protein
LDPRRELLDRREGSLHFGLHPVIIAPRRRLIKPID